VSLFRLYQYPVFSLSSQDLDYKRMMRILTKGKNIWNTTNHSTSLMTNPFENAMAQLSKAASFVADKKGKEEVEILRQPQRILNVSIPVRMDDQTLKIFQGYRVQFNNARGPYKGGIRFHRR